MEPKRGSAFEERHRSLLVHPESGIAQVTPREMNAWVLEQLDMLIEIYDKISQNYSIKSREKSSIPRHHLVDLALNVSTG